MESLEANEAIRHPAIPDEVNEQTIRAVPSSPETAIVPLPIEKHPDLDGTDANSEKSIMSLLSMTGLALKDPQAQETFMGLSGLSLNGWDRAKAQLKQDEIISSETTGSRISKIQLDPENLVKYSRKHSFISARSLETLRDNIGEAKIPKHRLNYFRISLDDAIKDKIIKEAPKKRKREDNELMASVETQQEQQKQIAKLVLANTLPKQIAEMNAKGPKGKMSFSVMAHERFFADNYEQGAFAKLFPLHKALLDIGNFHSVKQTLEDQEKHILLMINKNTAEETKLSKEEVDRLLEGAVDMGLINMDGKYHLEEKALDFLEFMKREKPTRFNKTS